MTEMSGATLWARRPRRETVTAMLSPNVIEIRRGSAHCPCGPSGGPPPAPTATIGPAVSAPMKHAA